MRKMMLLFALASGTAAMAQNDHYVRGYTRSDGTYVAPHMQTNPNSTLMDNYSTRGNVNPYTGREGTVDPYSTPRSNLGSSYGSTGTRSNSGW